MMLADRFWSDWLNPLLIKELRQGLRDRVYVLSLFGMQYLMASLVFFQLFANSEDQIWNIFRAVMWFTFVAILPIRGFFNFSVAHEVKQNTMETLLLSRIGSRGIVFGKWISLIFQSFLAVVIILPFLIIQYWVGGTDIADNLEELTTAFFVNGILSALSIGISCIQFSFFRFAALIGIGGLVFFLWSTIAWNMTPTVLQDLLILAIIGFFVVPLMIMEIASVYISISDSSPVMRRLGYLTLFIGGWCYIQSTDVPCNLIYGTAFVLVCFLESFQPAGPPQPNPPRVLARMTACFLAQTPLSGLLFTTVSVPLIVYLTINAHVCYVEYSKTPGGELDALGITLYLPNIILGTIYFPLALAELFLKRFRIPLFCVILINLAILGIVGLTLAALPPTIAPLWLALIPTAMAGGLPFSADPYVEDIHGYYLIAVATLGMITNVIWFNVLSLLYMIRMKRESSPIPLV